MPKIEFFSEFKIDKDAKIVEDFINLYWRTFVSKNKKGKELVFVKRAELVHQSNYNRRNCYKHLKHLLLANIFKEEESCLIPQSLIFKINKKTINPTEIIFGREIKRKDISSMTISIKPELSLEKTQELAKLIKIGKKNLSYFISVPFDMGEKIYSSHSFTLNTMPKQSRFFDLWEQKNKKAMEGEKELLKAINNNKDPFNHNCLMRLRGGDESPLLELEKGKKTYAIAGGIFQFSLKEEGHRIILGDYSDIEKTDSELLFYDEHKNLISKRCFVFPSSKTEGVPLADTSAIIFTRGNYQKNRDYLGYYDFKNDGLESRHFLNHVVIHFSKFNVPVKAKFIKIASGMNSTIAIANIFPIDKINAGFLKQRMQKLNTGYFIQDRVFPVKEPSIINHGNKIFKEINETIRKASYYPGKEKQDYLKKVLNNLIIYFPNFKKEFLKTIKSRKNTKNLPKDIYAFNRTISYLSSCLKEASPELNKKATDTIKESEKFYEFITPYFKELDTDSLSILLFAKYLDSIELFMKNQFLSLDKKLEEFRKEIKLMDNKRKIGIIDRLIPLLKQKIENDFFSNKAKEYLDYIIWLNQQYIKIYNEMAFKTIEFENKKGFDKQYIVNKYKLYENLSLYYQYQNVLYKTEYYKNVSEEKDKFEDLRLMLENFKKKIL